MCKNNCKECVLKRSMKEVNKNEKAIKVYNGKCSNKLFGDKCYLVVTEEEYKIVKGGER